MTTISLSRRNLDITILILLFVLTCGVRLYDLNGTGGTFDEHNYLRIAVVTHEALNNFDFSNDTWSFYAEHPPVGKYVLSLFYGSFIDTLTLQEKQILAAGFYQQPNISGDIYTPGRYASVLYGGLTVVLIYIFCIMFFSRTTGIIAGLILSVLPTFIPYFKVATLDAPTAFFYTLGTVVFTFAIKYDTWKWWIWLGVATGFGIATKFNMGMLLPFYAIMFLIWKGPHIWHSTKENYAKHKNFLKATQHTLKEIWYWKLFWVPVIAFIIFYCVWPWLWGHPLERLAIGSSGWTNPDRGVRLYPWFGNMEPPHLSAYVVYYLFTTPVLILFLFLFSCYHAIRKKGLWNWFLLLWFIIPPIIWTTQFNVVGPSIRYMIMTWPVMAILCAEGLQQIFKKRKHLVYAVLVLLAYLIIIDINIHPYYVDYYNELIGGPGNVQKNNLLNFDFFAEGKKEVTEWINAHAVPRATVGIKWDPPHDFGGFRPDLGVIDLIYQNYTGEPAYLLVDYRYNQYIKAKDIVVHNLDHYNLMHTVKAGSAEIGWIYELKH